MPGFHCENGTSLPRRNTAMTARDYETSNGAAVENRLRRNVRHLSKWARRAEVECYRVYDRDLDEFAFVVDRYARHVHVHEYEAPAQVDPERVDARRRDFLTAVRVVLEVAAPDLHVKTRRRQAGSTQYRRIDERDEYAVVREGPCRFAINLDDYLDTGLFLDHRSVREQIRGEAGGKRFLNLFCYTATATVHAAVGGARSSLSVDLSSRYLDWAARNFALNDVSLERHQRLRADCVDWLESRPRERFDLIFVDPPTFSNSKRMQASFDVQRDHVRLLEGAAGVLAHGGEIVFSNNRRRFRLDREGLARFEIRDVTRATIPKDFEGSRHVRSCFRLRVR